MTHSPDDSALSRTNLEDAIVDVASMSAPEENVRNVAQRVLDQTSAKSIAVPPTGGFSRRLLVAAGSSVLALTAVVLFTTDFVAPNVAFAQVQQQLEATQSLRYVEYLTDAGARRLLAEAENLLEMSAFEVQAMTERGQQMDAEQTQKRLSQVRNYIAEVKEKMKNGEPIEERRVWIQGRYLHRDEQSVMGIPLVHITNAETGESVSLDSDRKTCTLLKTQTVLNMKSGKTTVTSLGPNPARNFYAAMTQIPPGEVTKIGQKQIDGQKAMGFQQTEDLHDGIVTRTYWIDQQTRLPIRLDAVVTQDGVAIRGTTVRDMVFNQKLAPELFSTTPPAGYTVHEGTIMGLE